jgi:hypothetical protein
MCGCGGQRRAAGIYRAGAVRHCRRISADHGELNLVIEGLLELIA